MKKLACCIAAFAVPTLAIGAGLPTRSTTEKSLDFAVEIAKTDTVFDYANGTSADTTLYSFGVTWYERMAPDIELGLYGGRLFLSQTGNPATVGTEPDGYYAGIGLRGTLVDTSLLQLFAHLTYAHQRVNRNDSSHSVALSWDEPRAQLGFVLSPGGMLRVYGGATWETIEGQERVSGAAAGTIDFERRDPTGHFAGLDFAVERDGYVGIEVRSGTERGGEIYFKRRF